MTDNIAMFLIPLLENSGKSFGYAKKWRPKRMRKSKIVLPVDNDNQPNWDFMEEYIKQEQKQVAQKVIDYYEQKMLETSFDLVGLEDIEWKVFKIQDIFEVKPVKGKSISNYQKGNKPYVTTSSQNNGVNNFVEADKNISDRNAISVDPIGGKAFFHEYDFVGRGGAGSAINLLYNPYLDKYNGRFICTAIEKVSKEKASYGVQLNGARLRNTSLLLPIDETGNPNWDYMSKFMQKIEAENLQEWLNYIYRLALLKAKNMISLTEKTWSEFWLEDIVTISSGVRLTKANQEKGMRPFIGSSDNNNGVTEFVSNTNASLDSNVLGVNYNGSVVENFYHPYECIFSDDVKRIHWINKDQENRFTYLFLKQAILQQKVKLI